MPRWLRLLGLPSVAQAQTIGAEVTYADGPGFTVRWTAGRLDTGSTIDNWIVTFTKPSRRQSDETTTSKIVTPVMLDENDLGTWWIQVGACFMALEGDDDDECPDGELEEGPSVGYTHGAFPAPSGLTASLIPDGGVASPGPLWEDLRLRLCGLSILDGWREVGRCRSRGAEMVDAMAGDQTFMVRARGQSDNDLNTAEGMAGDAESNGAASSVEITVPKAAPTLPEIAALFLALLLLGSGAYLIRRRGTLTPA